MNRPPRSTSPRRRPAERRGERVVVVVPLTPRRSRPTARPRFWTGPQLRIGGGRRSGRSSDAERGVNCRKKIRTQAAPDKRPVVRPTASPSPAGQPGRAPPSWLRSVASRCVYPAHRAVFEQVRRVATTVGPADGGEQPLDVGMPEPLIPPSTPASASCGYVGPVLVGEVVMLAMIGTLMTEPSTASVPSTASE